MGQKTTVSLGDRHAGFLGDLLRTGRYDSADDAIRAGLDLLEEHESKIEALRAALIAGEQSGPARPFDFEAFKERKRSEHEGR